MLTMPSFDWVTVSRALSKNASEEGHQLCD